MHQAVLVNADIDECAKVRHVGDDAFEQHAGAQILQVLHTFLECGCLELGAGIAARLLELAKNVTDRRQAELSIRIARRIHVAQPLRVTHDLVQGTSEVGQDSLHERVGLGVDSRAVESLGPRGDAQEARSLLERLRAEARDFLQRFAICEGAVLVPVSHDGFRERSGQA